MRRIIDRATAERGDPRVQAIRCTGCHRLRPHPRIDSIHCECGAVDFQSTHPREDEFQLALKLYAREIEERNLLGRLAQEIADEKDNEYGLARKRVRLYSK